jgi:hypothetical protein
LWRLQNSYFTSDGTFCVSAGLGPLAKVDYLVIAGGGGGARISSPFRWWREELVVIENQNCATVSGCYTASPLASSTSLPVSVQGYPITVGGGGAGLVVLKWDQIQFLVTITSTGGGAGGDRLDQNCW